MLEFFKDTNSFLTKEKNMNMKKLRLSVVTVATTVSLTGVAVFVPFVAVADHTTAHTIEQLTAQITALQAQLSTLAGASAAPAVAGGAKCSFARSLKVGAKGDDVKCLQDYLTGTGHYTYSGGSTGYFGGVTKAAVAAWQSANGVSPAAGYFGALSRAKYDSVVVAAPAAPAAPVAGAPAAPAAPVAVGSGLTVTAPVDQPPASLAPGSAARVPFVKAILTASADGDVTVKSITVERTGLADDANFDGILLLDSDMTQIGLSKTLSSDHKVVLNESFVVKAGTSKTVTIAGNMIASPSAGQLAKLAVKSVDAGTSAVNGTFPIEGNAMTTNATLTIGSVTMSIGTLDPGAANTKNVGTTGYYLASVKAAVGSAENVTFESIRFNQAGSAGGGDLKNVKLKAGDKEYDAVVSSDGKYYLAKFADGLKVGKGGNLEFSVKADFVDGSARTVDMNVLRKSDIVVKGDTFGYNIIVGGGSSGTASAGAFSSNQEPFFNAYAATIDKGSFLVSSSSKVPSGNIPVDVADTQIGGFLLDVKGEDVQVSSFKLNFTFTGTGTSSDVTGVKIYNENGSIVAGPKDPASGVVTFSDTWTAPVGAKNYYVKARLDTTFVSDDSIVVSTDPDDNITAKGIVTGLSITAGPTSLVSSNKQTLKAATLAISVSPTPLAQNVVRGINQYHFATYVFDAGSSGEDARVTSIQLRDTVNATTRVDEVNTCTLYDGATALNTGSDVVNPDDPASGTTDDTTFTLTNNLIVPKGTVKKIDLKCNISPAADADSTHSWGTNAAAANVGSSGATTGQAITESITTSTGQVMSINAAGSFTLAADSASPSAKLSIAGKSDVHVNTLKFTTVDEAIKISQVTLTYSSSTASTTDFAKATLWDGATKLGEAVWAGSGSQFATSTLIGSFIIPKDGSKSMDVKVDLGSINTVSTTTAGRLLQIGYDGTGSSSGTGQSSGQTLGSGTAGNILGNAVKIMKSVPTFAKIAVPTTSVPQTNGILYRFSVTADAAGSVSLYKFTFSVSSSSVNATTSDFRIYGFSDSSFSQNAYANNPLNTNNVDCVGLSTFETGDTSCVSIDANPGVSRASSTDVVFFFGPATNNASSSEAIVISAGATRYFELRGAVTLTGSGTGNSVAVNLLGDAAYPVRGAAGDFNQGALPILGTADAAALQSANNNFVWAPNSTGDSATTTLDWTNGFNVPGLPATGLSSNTFTN